MVKINGIKYFPMRRLSMTDALHDVYFPIGRLLKLLNCIKNKPWGHYAKCNKPITEEQILDNSHIWGT